MNVLSLFDGKYYVLDDGRIFSNVGRRKELVGGVKKTGYREVLFTVNGKRMYKLVHRIIAESFIPNPLKKRTVNHKDGNKLNNNIDNLEWMTDTENLKHARDNGYLNTKINKEISYKIKNDIDSHRKLAKKYGISKTLIGNIKGGLRWA